MRLALVFAFRYVFSKKKTNAINIISGITVLAFAIGACAMTIVLSALNGFESTLTSLFNAFDPDLKIEVIKGKTFKYDASKVSKITKLEGVRHYAKILEDNAVVKYGSAQEIAVIKGVDENYNKVTQIDSTLIDGQFLLGDGEINGGVFGYDLAGKLGINTDNPISFVTVYAPKKGTYNTLNPEDAVMTERILPSGVFFVQEEIDGKYIIVSLTFARKLFGLDKEISAIEISLKPGFDKQIIKSKLKNIFGPNYSIKDKYEQKESIYKIFKSEKLATFSILSFILLIAAFNMSGSLTMLIIEKRKDISTLRSLGMKNHLIRQTFLFSGILIAMIGSMLGLIIGGLISWLQIRYGFISLENSVVDAYPMQIKVLDFFWVFIISSFIGILTAWIPTRKI